MTQTPGSFIEFLHHTDRLHEQAIAALAHLPRERAMSILLHYIGTDRLEEIMPTLTGGDFLSLKDTGKMPGTTTGDHA